MELIASMPRHSHSLLFLTEILLEGSCSEFFGFEKRLCVYGRNIRQKEGSDISFLLVGWLILPLLTTMAEKQSGRQATYCSAPLFYDICLRRIAPYSEFSRRGRNPCVTVISCRRKYLRQPRFSQRLGFQQQAISVMHAREG
jgi:hypothetical protein